jgi:thiol:disulfide interchange protein
MKWVCSTRAVAAFCSGMAALWVAVSGAAFAQPVVTEHAQVELLSSVTAVRPGETTTVGLSIKHAPHWHTYWVNPGDAGYATTLNWSLPDGYVAAPIQWPAPERIPFGPMVSFGYSGETLLPLTLTVPASAVVGKPVTLRAKASWLACNDVCIPEEGEIAVTLPVVAVAAPVAAAPAALAVRFASAMNAVPKAVPAWSATASVGARTVLVNITAPASHRTLSALDVFPMAEKITAATVQKMYRTADGYAALLQVTDETKDAALPTTLQMVVTSAQSLGDGGIKALLMTIPVTQVASVAAPQDAVLMSDASRVLPIAAANKVVADTVAAAPSYTLWSALGLAFLGGMVLNLMPCVFPVLSLKILGFAHHAGEGKAGQIAMRKHAIAYALGVVLSFMSLAAVLLALRAGGDAVGWGFQLQNPGVVWVLAVVFFVIGLNLSGAFEIGQLAPSSLLSLQAKKPGVDAFLGGVLAVVAASPCTAPFMGAALGFAVTQSAWVALSVFAALGVGMALPYVLLAWFPAWLKRLPRPGQWMISFKQLLAFPMFVTVVWLVWVVALQSGIDGAAVVLLGLVGLALAAWFASSARRPLQAVGLALAVTSIAWAWPGAAPVEPTASALTPPSTNPWQVWTPERVAELHAQGTPVFVDFTAAWCVSCQANKKMVLGRPEIHRAFADRGVVLLRADWTNRDERISRALTQLGRSGVPAYVLHTPKGSPVLLPELLTSGIVKAALAAM